MREQLSQTDRIRRHPNQCCSLAYFTAGWRSITNTNQLQAHSQPGKDLEASRRSRRLAPTLASFAIVRVESQLCPNAETNETNFIVRLSIAQ